MEWKVLPIGQLKPASYNPRKQLKPGDKEYEKIKHSIQEFGYVEPVIANYDMTVIGGHQRLTVLKELGYEEVQCVVVHIEDEHKVKALNIALNKITGAWNEQLLADLIVDLQSVDFNVDLTGFEAPEVEQLFSKVHNKKVKEDDFDVDGELEQPAMAKAGDIWLLGEHRVICGDATLPETYTRLMDGKKANLVLTDPPYNVDVEETAGKIKNDNMPDDKFYQFLFSAFVNMEQNMERDASIYVFHADTQGLNFRKAFKDAGFYLSGCCIWKKNALVLGRSPYQWQHEPCLFGWKLNPMFGAAAMSLSSFCVVTNALRLNLFRMHDASKDKRIKNEIQKEDLNMTTEQGMVKTMTIEGMMCGHCEARVKKTLEAIEGVASAEVSHEKGTAVVTLTAPVSDNVLKTAVEAQDYTVKGIQ